MPAERIVKITKNGNLLAVGARDREVCRILEGTLSYTRSQMVFERGRSSYVSLPLACYTYAGDEAAGIPRRLVCPAGYLQRVSKSLREHGYRPVLKDFSPPPRDGVFTPQWNRLSDVEWRWMQRTVVERLLANQYGQIKCPTGWGKSFAIYCLAKLLPKARMAVTTHSVDVLTQIHNELCRRLPQVGLIAGGKKRRGSRITCYGGKSLRHCQDPVDILVADEIHEFGTTDYMEILGSNPAFRHARRWGFGANAGQRPDGAWFEVEGFFGPILVDLSYQQCVEHGAIVPIAVHWRDVVLDRDPAGNYDNRVSKLRHGVWRNGHRNAQIAKDARSFGDDQVLISVETIEHALFLKKRLPEFSLCYSEAGVDDNARREYVNLKVWPADEPEMTTDRRQRLKEAFEKGKLRKAIATPIWNRGVDFKGLQVLIRGDAGASLISDTQIPGRTSRLNVASGKQSSIIVDYLDQFSRYLRERANTRRKNYRKQGWQQVLPGSGRQGAFL